MQAVGIKTRGACPGPTVGREGSGNSQREQNAGERWEVTELWAPGDRKAGTSAWFR